MQRIVITGVTSGFGQQWLYELDKQNEIEFFVVARNQSKLDNMLVQRPLRNPVQLIQCDLLSIDSITAAVQQIRNSTDSIDILVNNAGHWSGDAIEYSADGIESTLAVNQIAPFVLTGKLLPLLLKASNPRVVNTASFRHRDATPNRDDIQLTKSFNAERAYCNSKLFCVLFTQSAAARLSASGITVNCFDPGIVDTPMLKQAFPKKLRLLYPLVRRLIARTPHKGAETGVFLSVSSKYSGITGEYFKDQKTKRTSKLSKDKSLALWLWEETERLSGFSFPRV